MAKDISLPTDWTEKEATPDKVKTTGIRLTSFGVVLGIVVVAVGAAYYNSFNNGFHLDDSYGLIQNPWIRSLKNVPRFFVDPFTLTTLQANGDYRPVLQTTYAFNYAISQYNPWSWHLFNLILHLIVVLSLYLLGRILFGRGRIIDIPGLTEEDGDLLSLGATVLFAVHPITTGIANYMWARSSLLVTAFVLPATVLYLRAMRDNRGLSSILLPLGLYILALFTKVEAISFLGVLYIAEVLLAPKGSETGLSRRKARTAKGPEGWNSFLRQLLPTRAGWRRLLPFGVITVICFALRLRVLPPGVNEAWGVRVIDRTTYFVTQFRALWYYIAELLAPVQMVADYGAYPASNSLLDPRVLYALAGWILIAALLLYAVRRAPVVAFLGLAYFIYLSPTSSFLPLSEMVNEHRPYLPAAGLFLLGMLGLFLVARKLTQRPQLVFAVVVLLLALPLGALTHARNKVWKDDFTLWQDTVEKNPEAPRAQMNYGLALMERGNYVEAEQRFRETVRLAPFWDRARMNMGIVLAAQGKIKEAQPQYDEAVRLTPDSPDGYYWRGLFRSKQGDLAGAITDLQKAVALAHTPLKELQALADNLIRAGRTQEAREAIERGAVLDPQAFQSLRARLLQGNGAESQVNRSEQYQYFLNVGLQYYGDKEFEKAIEAFRKAIEAGPNEALGYNDLGAALNALERWDEAIPLFEKALTIDPKLEIAKNNLAWAKGEQAKKKKAVK
jgi:tetratricopeptide (TPR) repeat protein